MGRSEKRLSVALFGATGLVGGACLRLVARDPAFARVTVLTRRAARMPAPDARGPVLDAQVIDFDRPDTWQEYLAVDAIVCALGTTIRAAGSRERFRRVDYDYPLMIAQGGLAFGAQHLLLVSALGADPDSRVFYNRVKGELEQAVFALPYRRLTILRPSLLLGDRGEFRLGEELAKHFSFLAPARHKPIEASVVAETLVKAARERRAGHEIIESAEMSAARV